MAGQPLARFPGGGLASIGLDGYGQVSIYNGLKRVARLDRQDDGRWMMQKPRRVFDSVDAAVDWLVTPEGAQLRLA